MNTSQANSTVVCFGEILWDILPTAAKPGGAPMNVAYHLNRMGVTAKMISSTGKDERGEQLLELLKNWGISTALCQVDQQLATSEVHVIVGENHEVSYDILYPVAWDNIHWQQASANEVAAADAFVFGSLATRHETSRKTLYDLLEVSKFNVFDVNLRAPYFSTEVIQHLLHKTHLLKLNEAELELLTSWYTQDCTTEEERIQFLQQEFSIEEIIVTKGSKGATYFTGGQQTDIAAYAVKVADTVGSGDSFLAGFLAKKLQKETPEGALTYAAALAAFVTQQHGACPAYTQNEIEKFKQEKDCLVA